MRIYETVKDVGQVGRCGPRRDYFRGNGPLDRFSNLQPVAPCNFQQLLRPISGAILMISACVSICGCSLHVHSKTDAKNAGEAETKLVELGKAAAQSYSAMSANIERYKVEEEYVMKEVSSVALSALVTKLPTMTWKEVWERVQKAKDATGAFAVEVAKEARTFQKGTKDWAQEQQAAAEAVKVAKKRLDTARAQVEAWNASIAMLEKGLSNTKNDLSQLRKAETFSALTSIAQKAGDREVAFQDADGKEKKTKVKSILGDGLKGIIKEFEKKDGEARKPLLPDAPGIGVVLANLTLETAKIRLAVAEDELSYREQRAHLFEDAFAQIMLARELIDDIEKKIGNAGNPPTLNEVKYPLANMAFTDIAGQWQGHKDGREAAQNRVKDLEKGIAELEKEKNGATPEKPFPDAKESDLRKSRDELKSLRKVGYGEQALFAENYSAGTLTHLRRLAISESIILRSATVFPVACKRLAHQQSVSLSSLGDQAHQALFKATIAALRTYHEGGITSEDVANLIRLAQAIATVDIAASLR